MSSSTPTTPFADSDAFPPVTLVDLADRFGNIPATRICLNPPPGQATEEDLLYFDNHEDRLFELIDGTLIEKAMGNYESYIAVLISHAIVSYLKQHPIGIALPPDGQLRIRRNTIRVPDVAFIALNRLAKSGFPKQKIASVSPNLAVEVISESNSRKEMDEKLKDYFTTGSEEVWYIYPIERALHQFTSLDKPPQVWKEPEIVTTRLLSGFELNLAEIFALPPGIDNQPNP